MKAGIHPMYTLDLAHARIHELRREADESRRSKLVVDRPGRKPRP